MEFTLQSIKMSLFLNISTPCKLRLSHAKEFLRKLSAVWHGPSKTFARLVLRGKSLMNIGQKGRQTISWPGAAG